MKIFDTKERVGIVIKHIFGIFVLTSTHARRSKRNIRTDHKNMRRKKEDRRKLV